jgi:hypothetical protein
MGALNFSFSQGRIAQLLQTQQLPNPATLQPKQPNPSQQDLCIMEFDPNGYLDSVYQFSYGPMATECKHFVKLDSTPTVQPSLSENTHDSDSDWEDVCAPTNPASAPANSLLCKACEQALRTELQEARLAYNMLWACQPQNAAEDDEQLPTITCESRYASKRFVKAAIKVANFEGRMADRETTTKAAREQKWEAGKKVKFTVEEGQGSGEKPKEKKEKVSAIALGWVEVDQPTASPSPSSSPSPSTSPDDDTSYVFTYKPSIFTYHGDDEGY